MRLSEDRTLHVSHMNSLVILVVGISSQFFPCMFTACFIELTKKPDSRVTMVTVGTAGIGEPVVERLTEG